MLKMPATSHRCASKFFSGAVAKRRCPQRHQNSPQQQQQQRIQRLSGGISGVAVNPVAPFFMPAFHQPPTGAAVHIDADEEAAAIVSIIQQQESNTKLTPPENSVPAAVGANLEAMRKNYFNAADPFLLEHKMDVDPLTQFDLWFRSVLADHERNGVAAEEVNAVALSTVRDNRPSCRMVLVKRYDQDGFVFFTHAGSRKGHDLAENPYASMLFYWPKAVRQVRIEGTVVLLDPSVAEDYWQKRPVASRIGSKISKQSAVIPSREYLDKRQEELKNVFMETGEEAVTRPRDWLGYRLIPDYFEFWQGQRNRVHDRIIYEKNDQKRGGDESAASPPSAAENAVDSPHLQNVNKIEWTMKRLAP